MKKIIILTVFLFFNQSVFAVAQHLDDALENLSNSISKSIENKIKSGRIKSNKAIRIGIKGILQNDKHTILSGEFEDALAESLINSNIDVEVFERSKLLNNIKQELQKQNTDFYFDNLSAQEIGRFSAIDILITGEIIKRDYDVSIKVVAIKVSNAQKVATKKVFVHLNEVEDFLFKEKEKRHPLIEKAESGDINAMTELAINYKKGIGGFPLNAQLAKDWHIKAANLGQPISQKVLGLMYEAGLDSTNKDIKTALEWYKKSALQGNLGAIYNVDRLFVNKKISDKEWIEYIKIGANIKNKEKEFIERLSAYYLHIQNNLGKAKYWAKKLSKNNLIYQTVFLENAQQNGDEKTAKKFVCLILNNNNITTREDIAFVNAFRQSIIQLNLSCY